MKKYFFCSIATVVVTTMMIFNVNIIMGDVSKGVFVGLANLEALAIEEEGEKNDNKEKNDDKTTNDDKDKNGPTTEYEVTCNSGGSTSTTTTTTTTTQNNGNWNVNGSVNGSGGGFLGGSLGGGYNSGGKSTSTTTTTTTTTTTPSSTSKQKGYNCPKQTIADCSPFSPC